jgi:DNA primase
MLNKLIQKLGNYKNNSYNEYSFCCPFCIKIRNKEDDGFHLYINVKNLQYFCFKCKSSGHIKKVLGNNEDFSNVKLSDWKGIRNRVKYGIVNKCEKSSNIELPRDYMEIIKGSKAHEYLESRGISDEQIVLYKIGFGTENLLDIDDEKRRYYAGSGRIIFPDFDEDNMLKYWVARTYVDHQNKYRNPVGARSSDQLYGLHIAKKYSTVVITEGVISAIKGGRNCVATYGKNVTEQQVLRLIESCFETYIVALDGDAVLESFELSRRLYHGGCKNVRVVKYQDINDDPASVENFSQLVENSFCYNFSTVIKEKVLT